MQPLLLVSYGAPERQADVVPFLSNLFAEKNVPAERIAVAVQKYERYATKTGRYSPLNSECRKLIAGVQRIEPDLPIYWGNLFGHPLLVDTIAEMVQDGVKRALCFATSAFDSPSGNERYADALESARKTIGVNAPILEKLPLPFEHPLFIDAQIDCLKVATNKSGGHTSHDMPAIILFSAHSIPLADATLCQYVGQLHSTCRAVVEKSHTSLPWELVYQSRSGAAELWLGPDIKERIRELAAAGQYRSVIVSPIGFFCENMETEYDLDVEVGECCTQLGLSFFRAKAVGAVPKICQLMSEFYSVMR